MSELMQDLYERAAGSFDAEPEMPLGRWRAMIDEWPPVAAPARQVVSQRALAGEVA
jgi:hypothetical protein